MFYCICLDECYWTPRQFARQFARRLNRLKGWAEPVEKFGIADDAEEVAKKSEEVAQKAETAESAQRMIRVRGKKGQVRLYMFYFICLDECYWTPRQFARQFAHIPRPKVVRNADALDIMGTILFQAVPGLRRGIVL